jgi:HxlR-like helix-turn-helix
MLNGPKRFGEVQRLLPQASRQMLTIQLHELEQMGVLHRQTGVQGSLKVEYKLSELGQRSEPMLRQMYVWGRWCCEQLGLGYEWPVCDDAEERLLSPQNKTMTAFSSRGEHASASRQV